MRTAAHVSGVECGVSRDDAARIFSRVRSGVRAFTLIEVMVVMALLSVIVIGLMAMFNQTQKAFRAGMTQVDVLEAGRMATDLIARELEQVTPSYLSTSNGNTVNFVAGEINSLGAFSQPVPYEPLWQSLPASDSPRTNVLDDLFFLRRENQTWTAVGYFVRLDSAFTAPWGPVGTLYRFETNNTVRQFESVPALNLYGFYFNSTNYPAVRKLLDGVVHFRIRTFDRNGNFIGTNNFSVPDQIRTNYCYASIVPNESVYYFRTNAVPAYIEFELGILEEATLERYKSIPVASAQLEFLQKQANHVHLFRRRIPVRNVDPSAYQ